MTTKKHISLVEPLEDRIAPATIVNPYTVTFQDTDGDTAVVHISKPLFKNPTATANILVFTTNDASTEHFTGNSVGESLTTINLLGLTAAKGMNISVKAIPEVGIGNQLVNVDNILAGDISNNTATHNIDLGVVTIGGNLGSITVGDNFSTPALKSLTVNSMGPTSASNGESFVLGPISKLSIAGNMTGYLDLIGYQFGSIGKLTIGGALQGDSNGTTDAGTILFQGTIRSATIGSIMGGTGAASGALIGSSVTNSHIGSLTVLGAIQGNSGSDSGEVFANAGISKMKVGGNVTGGSGEGSALIAGAISNLNITGSLQGGTGVDSGSVIAQAFASNGNTVDVSVGTITIGGSVQGGTAGTASSGTTAAAHGYSGVIEAFSAKTISIGGALVGGTYSSGTATADTSGSILVDDVGSLKIAGGITGGSGANSGVVTGLGGFSPQFYKSIVIGTGITGGSGIDSGSILLNLGTVGTLQVNGNVTGGTAGVAASGSGTTATSAMPGNSGVIRALSAKTIDIQGALIGGNFGSVTNDNTTSPDPNATADTSGDIFVNSVNLLTINQGITGGSGPMTGLVSSGSIATLRINGNLTGGSGANSGEVYASTTLSNLFVGGSVIGGTANDTGEILSGGVLASGLIKGNITGNSSIASTSTVVGSGDLDFGSITSLTIDGNVSSGTNSLTGALANVGAIRSASNIGSLTIHGSVTGNSANPFVISATSGPATKGVPKTDMAIKSVKIGQDATYLDLLAGYSPIVGTSGANGSAAGAPLGTPTDGNAQIGTVSFSSNVSATNIVAGAMPGPNAGGHFGTAGDAAIASTPGQPALISSIANIIIAGTASGNSTAGDSFGFVAQDVENVTVGFVPVGLTEGPDNDHLVQVGGGSSNLFVNEVPPAS